MGNISGGQEAGGGQREKRVEATAFVGISVGKTRQVRVNSLGLASLTNFCRL